MKRCTNCQATYSDDVMRCPGCGQFLTFFVSDSHNRSASDRRVFSRRAEDDNDFESTESNDTRNTSPFEPGRRIDSSTDYNSRSTRQPDVDHYNPVPRGRGIISRIIIRLRPYLGYIIAIVLIVLAVVIIVINWTAIKPVLTCIAVGALIGAVAAIFLTRRHFNPYAVSAGAIIGAILACVFEYNILDIGMGLGALINALIPVCIMIFGIALIMRSLWKG